MQKTVRFAAKETARDYAESVATDVLQEKQKWKFKKERSGKGKGKKRRRQNSSAQAVNRSKMAGFNKGILAEFIIFLLLQDRKSVV